MQTVLGLWSSRGLTVGGKILVFKTLCFSKMQYIAQMSLVPKQIIEQLKLMHKKFLWKNDIPKIKHSTLIADYSDGRLKDVDIDAKLKALKLTWIRKLCDDSGHPWKVIPLAYLKLQNNEAIWHRNLCIDQKLLNTINGIQYQNFM